MGLIFDKGIEEALRRCVDATGRSEVTAELAADLPMREFFFGHVLAWKEQADGADVAGFRIRKQLEHIQELGEHIRKLEKQRERDVTEMVATIARNLAYERRVAELKESHDNLLTFTVGPLQVENAKQQVIIGKLESRMMQMLNAMAELETRITVWATGGASPFEPVDRDELMLWTVMLNNAMQVKPDRIRELAIACHEAWAANHSAPTADGWIAWGAAGAELTAEIERVLKEQKYEEAVERDLKLYGEVTDGTMFANPPRDIGQEILEGVRELKLSAEEADKEVAYALSVEMPGPKKGGEG